MSPRAAATLEALKQLGLQLALWLDQGLNAAVLGLSAVATAAATGARQDIAYADETLSAHTYRAAARGRIWGRLLQPVVDLLFMWQPTDPTVTDESGLLVPQHCRRAFHKKRLRRGLPADYSDPAFPPRATPPAP